MDFYLIFRYQLYLQVSKDMSRILPAEVAVLFSSNKIYFLSQINMILIQITQIIIII
jgi:hypothetical protein